MKVSQNIGIVNALIRITAGFTILTFATSKLTRKHWKESYLLLAALGAMKVGEGILRYCPIVDLFESRNDHDHNHDYNKGASPNKSIQNLMNKFMSQEGTDSILEEVKEQTTTDHSTQDKMEF
ncbi:YgaP family membrane protein [Bacillus coahuilensis]|uniref:YgaP family membrane protein n=1 Tax=Bacillus coahuilensis TaxID=408580 RepID=UPI0001850A2F|nr:DUF2892 domain-containing protein [Bacillus coahuilensis]